MELGGGENEVLVDLMIWEGVQQRAMIIDKERGSAE